MKRQRTQLNELQKKKSFYKKHAGFFYSVVVLFLFLVLMIYALKKQPDFIPSQLYQKEAPRFTAPLFEGGEFSLENFFNNDQWSVVTFWNSSCYICRKETENLNFFYKNYASGQNKIFNFISVNTQDSQNTIAQWVDDLAIIYPIAMDFSGKISLDYGVTGTPEYFIISPQGKVRFRVSGSFHFIHLKSFTLWLESNPQAKEEEALTHILELSAK